MDRKTALYEAISQSLCGVKGQSHCKPGHPCSAVFRGWICCSKCDSGCNTETLPCPPNSTCTCMISAFMRVRWIPFGAAQHHFRLRRTKSQSKVL